MNDLLKSDRIRKLLREADDAKRLLGTLPTAAEESREVREALTGIYRDLGQELHESWKMLLVHQGPERDEPEEQGASLPLDLPTHQPDEDTDVPDVTTPPVGEDLDGWYTDEVELDEPEAFFSPGDLEATDPRATGADPATTLQPGDPGTELPTVDSASPPEWLCTLRTVLEPIDAPPSQLPPMEFCLRVQWACSQIDHVSSWPRPVQIAFVALLASHARSLRLVLPEEAGPKMALDRLRRWALAAGLPIVAALMAKKQPVEPDWALVAQAWRAHLRSGLCL